MDAPNLKTNILNCLNQQDYMKALEYYLLYEETGYSLDDSAAILGGTIFHYLGERDNEWEVIRKGLEYNPFNYELYVMLGNYYLGQNLYQAYLCYENALFYCHAKEDKDIISTMMEQFRTEYQITVPKASIVILSYNLIDYTKQCIKSIRDNTPESAREMIVVDNASMDGSVEWLRMQPDIILIENTKNLGFPVGCNQGIRASSPDCDIFLLNNDTIITPNSLFWLRMGLYEKNNVGSTGSVSNYVANDQQINGDWKSVDEVITFSNSNNIPMKYPYEEKLCLVGFAVLIKRAVLNKVGLLDEIFTPGNCEDVDYSLRILKAGYHNILCKNSFIIHFGSRSFKKDENKYTDLMAINQKKLNSKWDINLRYYMFPRPKLVKFINENTESPLNILDIGCGCGAIMAKLKSLYPFSTLYGIEIVLKAAEIAKSFGDVICGNVEEIDFPYPEHYFDYCVLGDVLEHLHDPQNVLIRLRKHMKKDGHIVLSMPNVKHWSVFLPLLKQDKFTYEDAGILDKTHLKMYTFHEILKLLILSGYELQDYTYTTMGTPSEEDNKIINELVKYMVNPNISTFMAYQYIILAKVK